MMERGTDYYQYVQYIREMIGLWKIKKKILTRKKGVI